MAEDVRKRFERLRWVVTKLEHNHAQVDEMMRLQIADGLGAMRYGQYGGSFPDPTARTVFDANGDPREAVKWRDHRPEDDLEMYHKLFIAAEKALEEMDVLRRRYMSANMDMWRRLDESAFCRPHWFLMHRDPDLQKLIPQRVTGDLCKDCNGFREANGRAPEPLEVEYFAKNLRWPHKLYDPKERRAV